MEQILSGGIGGNSALAQNLEGNVAMKEFIARAVDDTHPTFADFGVNAIVAENLTDHPYAPVFVIRLRVYNARLDFQYAADGKLRLVYSRLAGLKPDLYTGLLVVCST